MCVCERERESEVRKVMEAKRVSEKSVGKERERNKKVAARKREKLRETRGKRKENLDR